MKTRLFTLLFVLMSTVVMFAQRNNVMEKIEHNSTGYTKELILMDKNNLTPVRKAVYEYTANGYLTKKVIYNYDSRKVAVALCKLDCNYDEKNNPTSFVFTKWDSKAGRWSDKTEEIAYYYNANGGVIIQKSEVNRLSEDFLTVKE